MLITIHDLLKTWNLSHIINAQHPVLSLPLSLFAENQRSELISILYLYGSQKIDLSLTSHEKLQDVSRAQVKEYFELLVTEVTNIFEKGLANQHAPIQITTKLEDTGSGITSAQITAHVINHPIMQLLINNTNCEVSFSYLKKYLAGQALSHDEQRLLIAQLNTYVENGSYEARFNNLIFTLESKIVFKKCENRQTWVYKRIIDLNHEKTAMHESEPSIQTINYFQEVFMALSKLYPTTLKSIYVSLGIALPEQLTPELKQILQLDLTNISKAQLPELIYYTSLFIFGYATTEITLLTYTYKTQSISIDLKNAAKSTILSLKLFLLDGFDKCTGRFNSDFKELLQQVLQDYGLTTTSKRLGLLCLTNCGPLRALFIKVYRTMSLTIKDSFPIELTPSTNPFVIGGAFYEIGKPKPWMLNDSDFDLLKKLNIICKRGVETSLFLPGKVSPAIRQRFNDIKSKITNPLLKEKLSPENIDMFRNIDFIDYEAIVLLVQEYGIHAKNSPPPLNALRNLFQLPCENSRILHTIASHLKHAQLNNVTLTLEQLDSRLETRLPQSSTEKERLNYRWYQFERDIYIEIKKQLPEQYNVDTIGTEVRKQLEENAAHQEDSSTNAFKY